MNITMLQHASFEGPGRIAAWADARGHQLEIIRLDRQEPLPPLERIEALISLGGPMGVHDQALHPWIDAEVSLLRQALKRRLPILGICLGAQLLAVAAGAGVRRNPEREIGCFPIQWTPEAQRHPLTSFLPDSLEVIHWHGDTFALPPGAQRLARSEACLNQALVLHRALGLQFHLEMGPEEVSAVAAACPGDLAAGAFVQELPHILAQERVFSSCRSALFDLMDLWSGGRTLRAL